MWADRQFPTVRPALLYGLRLTEDAEQPAAAYLGTAGLTPHALEEAVRRISDRPDPPCSPYAPGHRLIASDHDFLAPLRRMFDGWALHPTVWAEQIDGYLEELVSALDDPVVRVELTWEPLLTLPSGATLWRRP